jgi:hypothetical protein
MPELDVYYNYRILRITLFGSNLEYWLRKTHFPTGVQPLPGGVGYTPYITEEFQFSASPPSGLNLAPHICTHRSLFCGKIGQWLILFH